MKTLEVNEAVVGLTEYAQEPSKETLILTINGRPFAAVLPIEDADWETIALSTNPEFQAIIARSRARLQAEGGISQEEISRELGVKSANHEAFADVYPVLYEFKGQQIPGHLLNAPGEVTLPTFTQVDLDYRIPGIRQEVDMFAQGTGEQWVIEIKTTARNLKRALDQVSAYSQAIQAKPWLIVFANVSLAIREAAAQRGIYLSGAQEWYELKKLVAPGLV